MTHLFWADREPPAPNESSTNVLDIGNASSRLITRSRRAAALNTWAWFLSVMAYYGIAIAIFLSPPYQAAAPWRNAGLTRSILTLFFLGGFLHMFWASWWVPRFSVSNPTRVVNVQIKNCRLGHLKHRLEVETSEEVFALVVKCPRGRLAKALDELGIVC